MRIEVFPLIPGPSIRPPQDGAVVIIDILRATSSMVAAIWNGAEAVYPTATLEQARSLASRLGSGTLLAGERRNVPPPGFQHGNSPREFTREAVAGRRLVITTTNGTRALRWAEGAGRLLIFSFLNGAATARFLQKEPRLTLVCSGSEDRFSLEDFLAAGRLLALLEGMAVPLELDDLGRVARSTWNEVGEDGLPAAIAATDHARELIVQGIRDDLPYCAQLDIMDVVVGQRGDALRALPVSETAGQCALPPPP